MLNILVFNFLSAKEVMFICDQKVVNGFLWKLREMLIMDQGTA